MPNAVPPTVGPSLESIFDALPGERGGPENRRGLAFQDHVAVGFMLEMLERNDLLQVWCETEDDITLIWQRPRGVTEAEFVQVKSDDPDRFWTVALLCRRKQGTNRRRIKGSSILERSLARDRFREPCCFRIVTEVRINRDLRHLRFPINHRQRQPGSAGYTRFEQRFPARFRVFRSPNGNDWRYWVEKVVWEVRHSIEAVRDRNLHRLQRILSDLGLPLAPDQLEQLYDLLVRKAYELGMADGQVDPESKRMARGQFQDILVEAATQARSAGAPADVSTMEWKMDLAGLTGSVPYAREARLRFLRERRTSRYFSTDLRERFEDEVGDRLQELWAQFQDGTINDSPPEFYTRCIRAIDVTRTMFDAGNPMPSTLPRGAMFDRVNRCLHRFTRLSL